MLGQASSPIGRKVPTSPHIFLPAQIPRECCGFNKIKINNNKLMTCRAKVTVKNCIDNRHLGAGNSALPSNTLRLLEKPTMVQENAIISHLVEEILAPHRPLVNANEQEEEELEYFDSKVGDLVIGIVVSLNNDCLDIDIGSDRLATMYLNEFLPMNQSEMEHLLCELPTESNADGTYNNTLNNSCNLFANGKMGILKEKMAISSASMTTRSSPIDEGTVLYAEVLGRTLSGEPLLSSRRVSRRIAWRRVKQIKQENEPIDIYISEWNTSGLISKIEGLRAFLPRGEMLNPPLNNFAALKEKVGMQMSVVICKVNEETSDLIVSEKVAWEMRNFYEGNLLEGTVKRLLPYGAQVKVDGTSISGLLHISNISCARVPSVRDLFSEEEKVKVMVVRSRFPNKASFSTADLESQKGLILSDKEKVFEEAEQLAATYRSKLSSVWFMHGREACPSDLDTCDNTAKCYANWEWLQFDPDSGQ